MAQTYLFYDLETTGKNPSTDRILQFAAQRTDASLKNIGEPVNLLIKLTDDILPSPQAALVTGLTPQKTEDGISELALARLAQEKLFTPDTIVIGYNNVSFDDNFMRYLFWRNFFDPYEWAWRDGRSRWDLCNVTRMVRAIRPDNITWPVDDDGKACNKLEKLTEANGLNHHQAHDGLSDVIALIELAQLIHQHQPKMFSYLLSMRDKNKVAALVNLSNPQPFVYTTTRYGQNFDYTSVAIPIAEGNTNSSILTYNLRYDPTPWLNFSATQLAEFRFTSYEELNQQGLPPFPVHTLTTNQCPAVAPVGVLSEQNGWDKLDLNPTAIDHNVTILKQNPQFIDAVREAYAAESFPSDNPDPETRLYDGFLNDADRQTVASVRNADAKRLATWDPYFHDERLPELLIHYKAHNFRDTLSQTDLELWNNYRTTKLKNRQPEFNQELAEARTTANTDQQHLLDQLQQWHDRVMPK
jgi:exodeoxyribonuclease-1